MSDSLMNEPLNADTNNHHEHQLVQPAQHHLQNQQVTNFSALFAYQANLLVQHYGKQASSLLDRILSKQI